MTISPRANTAPATNQWHGTAETGQMCTDSGRERDAEHHGQLHPLPVLGGNQVLDLVLGQKRPYPSRRVVLGDCDEQVSEIGCHPMGVVAVQARFLGAQPCDDLASVVV
ncbi:hypothetical protein AB0I84_32855 [Streptomyces spectabilis]|uniref:hypothetical protein n=1 Tax=Streptomyces spectabilis TaxID=68270 RepID=UPI0033E089BB